MSEEDRFHCFFLGATLGFNISYLEETLGDLIDAHRGAQTKEERRALREAHTVIDRMQLNIERNTCMPAKNKEMALNDLKEIEGHVRKGEYERANIKAFDLRAPILSAVIF